jgi:hypothetical protein
VPALWPYADALADARCAAAQRALSPVGPLIRGARLASAGSYSVAMAALIDSEAFDDDWTAGFIQEIENSVRERFLRELVSSGMVATDSDMKETKHKDVALTISLDGGTLWCSKKRREQ